MIPLPGAMNMWKLLYPNLNELIINLRMNGFQRSHWTVKIINKVGICSTIVKTNHVTSLPTMLFQIFGQVVCTNPMCCIGEYCSHAIRDTRVPIRNYHHKFRMQDHIVKLLQEPCPRLWTLGIGKPKRQRVYDAPKSVLWKLLLSMLFLPWLS